MPLGSIHQIQYVHTDFGDKVLTAAMGSSFYLFAIIIYMKCLFIVFSRSFSFYELGHKSKYIKIYPHLL